MKTVILAGGHGTRLGDKTVKIPKPMLQICGQPILYRIMEHYARFGFSDFLIAGGYRINVIADWLKNAYMPWKVELVDTGLDTQTGGRLKRLAHKLPQTFLMTYGDGLSTVNLTRLIQHHNQESNLVTVTAVHPSARFGELHFKHGRLISFGEKTDTKGWINGGFMVVHPAALDWIDGDGTAWEAVLTQKTECGGPVGAYKHHGFWQCVDTERELNSLNESYREGKIQWV